MTRPTPRLSAIRLASSIASASVAPFFTLSQVYEDLLLKMGEKNSDGGQFFTPREVIRVMVHTVEPRLGETIYDPCCGTGGFLAIAYEHLVRNMGNAPAGGSSRSARRACEASVQSRGLVKIGS
jgi:hypothetical protein